MQGCMVVAQMRPRPGPRALDIEMNRVVAVDSLTRGQVVRGRLEIRMVLRPMVLEATGMGYQGDGLGNLEDLDRYAC